jgi:polysaccharide deacetylase family protein (PEP-CTERM system associated)
VRNVLSLDIEDYVSLFFRDALAVETPVSHRVVDCTKYLLDVLERRGTGATCFCLGSVAKAHPRLIREILERGFEVGAHGMNHIHYHRHDLKEIRSDVLDGKSILEDIGGCAVRGFRAPLFNVSLSRPEVIECIAEAGFEYDSSVFPFRGRRYGSEESPRGPYRLKTASGSLFELPLCTARFAGRRVPAAGGGYLRHFPYFVSRLAIRSVNQDGLPAIVYLHPYECDTEPLDYPRAGLSLSARLRAYLLSRMYYRGRAGIVAKLEALTRDFSFCSAADYLSSAPVEQFPAIVLG